MAPTGNPEVKLALQFQEPNVCVSSNHKFPKPSARHLERYEGSIVELAQNQREAEVVKPREVTHERRNLARAVLFFHPRPYALL